MEFDFSKPISPCFGKAQVEFTEPRICHGFVLWIDWVMDIDNSIVLSTGPDKRYWKQGIKLLAKPVTIGIHGSSRGFNFSYTVQSFLILEHMLWTPVSPPHESVVLVKIHSPMHSNPNRVVKWVPDCSTIVAARIASKKLLRSKG